jgi:hypothetical protein
LSLVPRPQIFLKPFQNHSLDIQKKSTKLPPVLWKKIEVSLTLKNEEVQNS